MDENNILAEQFIKELEAESKATRKCLEAFQEKFYDWKPHDKSMKMGDLASIVADIPRWIQITIEEGEIDFATYERVDLKTGKDMVKHYDKSLEGALGALRNIDDVVWEETFYLKNEGKELASGSKRDNVALAINHLVHHRGQLTVYMRLNDIPVPSIYGPSADEKTW